MTLWTRLRTWWTRPFTNTGERLIGPIPPEVLDPALRVARARGETLRDVTVRALRAYGREGQ